MLLICVDIQVRSAHRLLAPVLGVFERLDGAFTQALDRGILRHQELHLAVHGQGSKLDRAEGNGLRQVWP